MDEVASAPTRRSIVLGGAGLLTAALPLFAAADDTPVLSRMAAPMIMMGFRGSEPSAPGAKIIASHLAAGRIGGVILFEDNCASPAATRRLTRAFAEAAGSAKVLIGIDQEGGMVSRLQPGRGFQALPSANAVAHMSPGEAEARYDATAAELRDIGITMNFAPVVDLDRNPTSPIIGALGRSFGTDPDEVIAFARILIDAHRRHRVLTSLKHFPGHGSSGEDSHRSLPDITTSWKEEELRPFSALVDAGYADTVMVGHLIKAGLTETGRPASLSRRAIENMLRRNIGFGGVVVSDDMQMGALRRFFSPDDSIRLGLEAGLDLFVFSNREYPDPEMPARFHKVVKDSIAGGRLTASRIEGSVKRLDLLKRRIA